MKYLQIANAALAAFGAAMALIMAVVVLIYLLHLPETPRLQRELPALVAVMLGFLGVGAFAGLAFWGHRRGRSWAWIVESVLALTFAVLLMLLLQLR